MIDLETLFCEVDDFCQFFELEIKGKLLSTQTQKRHRKSRFSLSEVLTIIIYFHCSNYRHFKNYYANCISKYHSNDFPNLVSYNRFIELIPQVLMPLLFYLNTRKGKNTGISFIDSTPIPVCHSKRAKRNQVFKGLSAWGKNSIGWYYGFKLHLVINEKGELKLVTPFKKNMKNKLVELWEKIMLRKRSLIETVNDPLKNISQIVHSRHRSVYNFMVNIIAGLVAYTFQEKKPSLNLDKRERENLAVFVG